MWPISSILMPMCSIFFPPMTSMSTWLAAEGLTVRQRRLCTKRCARHCDSAALEGWHDTVAHTVPHTLSTAPNRYCSTSLSFTLVVTVCRVSASAKVNLNFAGAPVKKELSDIRRSETPTPRSLLGPSEPPPRGRTAAGSWDRGQRLKDDLQDG